MIKIITKILLILFFINLSNLTYAAYENKIVLKVENKIITNFEIKNKILITLILSKREINQKNINALKSQALETLIQIKLKEIELSKYDIKKDTTQINQYLNSISSNDIPNLKKKFLKNNLDFQIYLNEIETLYKWQKLIYEIYSNKIEIDTDLIDNELENFVNNNSNMKEFNLSEIEILMKDNNVEKSKISIIQKEIQENGFETAAMNYSISTSASDKGSLGWINENILSAEMSSVLRGMKIGEITQPIKKQNTILFFKINDVRSLQPKDLDKANLKKKIINQRKNELYDLYSRSHLSKIQNTSLIEYK